MVCKPLRLLLPACAAIALFCAVANAEANLRIPLPKKSKPTPVQKLNRAGVRAIEKRQYNKAKEYFYHAYLLDPDDPFTLNNLGYISELQGDVDRAQRYYELAEQNASSAVIDKSNLRVAEGQPFSEVVRGVQDRTMQVNRTNVEAMRLLSHGRPQEAETLLQQALSVNPSNPFTLNNLGFTKEMEGELKDAQQYYQAAAQLHSNESVIVAVNQHWRGRPISKVAAENAKAVEREMRRQQSTEEQVSRLNLRGVYALNRNDLQSARRFFEQAYKLDPGNAFTLNNMGYLLELDGDRESANEFYARARAANRANDRVTLSTRRDMEGLRMGAVADVNHEKVENRIEAVAEARRREGGPIQLKRRNGAVVTEPEAVPQTPPGAEPAAPQTPPVPENVEPPPQTPRPPSPYSPEPPPLPQPQLPGTETNPRTPPPSQPPPTSALPQQTPQSAAPTNAPVMPQTQPSPTPPPQNIPQGISPPLQTQPPSTQPPPTTPPPQ